MEHITQETQSPAYDFSQIARRFGEKDMTLVANVLLFDSETGESNVKANDNDQTWESKFNRETGEATIGTAPLPENIKQLWGWGTKDPNMENLLKILHENSHAFQKSEGLEDALCRWLVPPYPQPENPRQEAYIELYEIYKTLGRVNGLSTMQKYEMMSQETGRLSMPILEDITETMAAYTLGEDYLNFRLDNGLLPLTTSTKEMILDRIRRIFGG
jgi:hypothetical protein